MHVCHIVWALCEISVSSWESERPCICSVELFPQCSILYLHFSSSDTQQINIKIIQINCTKILFFCLECNLFLERVWRYQRVFASFSDNKFKYTSSKQYIKRYILKYYLIIHFRKSGITHIIVDILLFVFSI